MLDSCPGPSGTKRSPSQITEEEATKSKRLLTEEDIKDFLGGEWPIKNEDAEFVEDGPVSENSDDEGVFSKRQKTQPPADAQESGWSEDPLAFVPTHFLEGSPSATKVREQEKSGPMTFFEMVLTPPIIDMIITSTNQSAEILKLLKKKSILYSSWKPLSELEFKIFLGLLYHMEEIRLRRLKDYWKRSRLYAFPIFQNMMSRNRFLSIMGALSFNTVVPPVDEAVKNDDKLYRLRPLIDHFNNIIVSFPIPGVITFEESLKAFKDNTLFVNYSWYKRIGVFILHMLVYSSWVIYSDQCGQEKITLQKFRLKVVDALLPQFPPEDTPAMAQVEKPHYMSYIGVNEKGKKRRKRCKYCMDVKNKRKESYFCCIGCNNHPGFCIDGCFAKFHGYL